MPWHPVISNEHGRETNWLVSFRTESAALVYAEAWAEWTQSTHHDAVEVEDEDEL